jgi:transcriptional regulator with XRE-family HTH domain
MADVSALIEEIKRALREAELTYRDVAAHLGLSEASVKRMFAREQFTLQRLERVLGLLRMDFAELVERVHDRRQYVSELTPEQEQALINDEDLLVIAFLALNRWAVDDIQAVYDFPERDVQRMLIKLDRLKIIELLPFNRYRLLTARNFTWRKNGPVQQYFATRIQSEFFASAFAGGGEELRFVAGTLSPDGIRQMHRSIAKIAAEFDELAERGSRLPTDERYGCSAVFALRPMEFSMFARHRKAHPQKFRPLPQKQ